MTHWVGTEANVTKIQEFVYELKVEQVMTRDVVSVTPDLHMNELREILRENRIAGVPVLRAGRVIGLVSIEDFINWLSDGSPDCRIADRMSADVVTIPGDVPLAEAIRQFETLGFGRLPVVDRESECLVGILTKSDIVRGLLEKLQVDSMAEEIHTYRASHIFQDIVADYPSLCFGYHIKGNGFDRAGSCASGLKTTLRRLGLHPSTVRRVAIATYEAEMNVVIYAQSGELTAEVEPSEIRIKVRDAGPGIEDIEQAMRPGFSTAPDWVRELGFGAGMGLDNIRRCSDSMNLASTVGKGTELDISISLPEETEAK